MKSSENSRRFFPKSSTRKTLLAFIKKMEKTGVKEKVAEHLKTIS